MRRQHFQNPNYLIRLVELVVMLYLDLLKELVQILELHHHLLNLLGHLELYLENFLGDNYHLNHHLWQLKQQIFLDLAMRQILNLVLSNLVEDYQLDLLNLMMFHHHQL